MGGEKVRMSGEKCRDLIDNAPVGIYKTNLKGDIFYVNKALSKMFGFESPEEMMLEGVLTRYENLKDREILIENLKKTGKVNNLEIKAITRSGEPKNILLSATLESDIISGMIIDITGQKKIEEELRNSRNFLKAVIEGITDGISILNRDFEIVMVNENVRRMYSGNPIGKKCYEYYHSANEICDGCPSKKAFETGEMQYNDVPYHIERKQVGWIGLSAYPMRDSEGRVTHIIEHVKDITEHKRLENELERSNRELKAYAKSVSHALKNPLNIIRLNSYLLLQQCDEDEHIAQRQAVAKIDKAAEDMGYVIDDLLTLAEIDGFSKKETVQVKDTLDKIFFNFQDMIGDNDVKIQINDEMPEVTYPSAHLNQVFSNLISNSIKYRKKAASLEINIRCKMLEDYYEFSVEDNGIGIPRGCFNYVYIPFRRFVDSREIEGTGIGLAIVKRIVEQNGGRTWFSSNEGSGTTFYFTIPKT